MVTGFTTATRQMTERFITDINGMEQYMRIIISCAIIIGAYTADFLCCKLLAPLIQKITHKTSLSWDDHLTDDKVLHNAFHLIPPITFYVALPLLFPEELQWTLFLRKIFSIYIIAVSCRLVCGFISSLYVISNETDILKNRPMKGVYQMLKVVVICISIILIIGVLLEKDFTTLIAGLGASAAILMLVFKDTIMGVVAGVQLSAHDMLRPGDWIMLDKYGINGTVTEVSLNTVKIRSWDNSIVTIPPYVLVSDSFKNWRGMRESGGRRVTRTVFIDINSIRFLTNEEASKLSGQGWAKDINLSDKTVNLNAFRAFTEDYLRNHPKVNGELMLMVRQLTPTPEGLPLEIYFFTTEKDWVPYEHVASDVMEHIFAFVPVFGLKMFQRPSGDDMTKMGKFVC